MIDAQDHADLMKVLDRRDFLCRNVPRCHRCDTNQVQLKHMDKPAEWKCRKCKLDFQEEPDPEAHALPSHKGET